MSQSANPVQDLIAETRSAFETETTISRILGRTKESLERFLANPASLDQIKESLARVLARFFTSWSCSRKKPPPPALLTGSW